MPRIDWKNLHAYTLASLMALTGGMLLLPTQAAHAQAAAALRGLPDFTDLVDQVGPSVVNIRTLEKASDRPAAGAMDAGVNATSGVRFRRRCHGRGDA